MKFYVRSQAFFIVQFLAAILSQPVLATSPARASDKFGYSPNWRAEDPDFQRLMMRDWKEQCRIWDSSPFAERRPSKSDQIFALKELQTERRIAGGFMGLVFGGVGASLFFNHMQRRYGGSNVLLKVGSGVLAFVPWVAIEVALQVNSDRQVMHSLTQADVDADSQKPRTQRILEQLDWRLEVPRLRARADCERLLADAPEKRIKDKRLTSKEHEEIEAHGESAWLARENSANSPYKTELRNLTESFQQLSRRKERLKDRMFGGTDAPTLRRIYPELVDDRVFALIEGYHLSLKVPALSRYAAPAEAENQSSSKSVTIPAPRGGQPTKRVSSQGL